MAFLNIVKTQNKNIVKAIDIQDYMKLGKPTSRLDLFDFAVALAARYGAPDINNLITNKESFIRDEYIGKERYMLASIYFDEHVKQNPQDIDSVIDDNVTFPVAEVYAEEGFNILKDFMQSKGEMLLTHELLQEMDIIYDRIKDSLPKEKIGYEFSSTADTPMAADDTNPLE